MYDVGNLRFDLLPGVVPKLGSGERDETLMGLLSNLSLEGLSPEWIRPLPPRLPVQNGEVRHILTLFSANICSLEHSRVILYKAPLQLVWLNLDDHHELLWDHGMCVDTSRGAAVRDLIAKALKGPLAPAQQEVQVLQ